MLAEAAKHSSRNGKQSPHNNRVYTYTYNESPMSKELERGTIKTTVVR